MYIIHKKAERNRALLASIMKSPSIAIVGMNRVLSTQASIATANTNTASRHAPWRSPRPRDKLRNANHIPPTKNTIVVEIAIQRPALALPDLPELAVRSGLLQGPVMEKNTGFPFHAPASTCRDLPP